MCEESRTEPSHNVCLVDKLTSFPWILLYGLPWHARTILASTSCVEDLSYLLVLVDYCVVERGPATLSIHTPTISGSEKRARDSRLSYLVSGIQLSSRSNQDFSHLALIVFCCEVQRGSFILSTHQAPARQHDVSSSGRGAPRTVSPRLWPSPGADESPTQTALRQPCPALQHRGYLPCLAYTFLAFASSSPCTLISAWSQRPASFSVLWCEMIAPENSSLLKQHSGCLGQSHLH